MAETKGFLRPIIRSNGSPRLSPERKLLAEKLTTKIFEQREKCLRRIKSKLIADRKEKETRYNKAMDEFKKIRSSVGTNKYADSPFNANQLEQNSVYLASLENEVSQLFESFHFDSSNSTILFPSSSSRFQAHDQKELATSQSAKTVERPKSPTTQSGVKFPNVQDSAGIDNGPKVVIGQNKLSAESLFLKSSRISQGRTSPQKSLLIRPLSANDIGQPLTDKFTSEKVELQAQSRPDFVYRGIESRPFHTQMISGFTDYPLLITLFRSIHEEGEVISRKFDSLNLLKPTAPDRMLVKVYDPVDSREASTVINLRELTLHLYSLREKYSPTAADHYKPGETWWWAENINSVLAVHKKPKTGMLSASIRKQAIEKIVVDGLSLASQSEDASPDSPTSDEAAQAEALTMIPVHSELVEDIYAVPVILSLLSSGDSDINNTFDIVKYDPSKHYPSVRPPPTRLTLKVVDLVASVEASCHLNFEDLANFLYHLREKYSLRAVQFFHPISVDWWVQNARKVVDVSKTTARDGAVKMSVSVSKREIERLVTEGLAVNFIEQQGETGVDIEPEGVDAEIQRHVNEERAKLHLQAAAVCVVSDSLTHGLRNFSKSLRAVVEEAKLLEDSNFTSASSATSLAPWQTQESGAVSIDTAVRNDGVLSCIEIGCSSTAVAEETSCEPGLPRSDENCNIFDADVSRISEQPEILHSLSPRIEADEFSIPDQGEISLDGLGVCGSSTVSWNSQSSATQIVGLAPAKKKNKDPRKKYRNLSASEAVALDLILRGRSTVNKDPAFVGRKLSSVEKRLLKSPLSKPCASHIYAASTAQPGEVTSNQKLEDMFAHNKINPKGSYALTADAQSRRDGIYVGKHDAVRGHDDLYFGGKNKPTSGESRSVSPLLIEMEKQNLRSHVSISGGTSYAHGKSRSWF